MTVSAASGAKADRMRKPPPAMVAKAMMQVTRKRSMAKAGKVTMG